MFRDHLIYCLVCVATISCARIETMGLTSHKYGIAPKRIIWFQIPGLNEDHVSALRFNIAPADSQTSFEKFSCLGKMWTYNLYNLRPDASDGLMSQLVGKENINSNCDDFGFRPIWDYLNLLGYKTGIVEAGADDSESLDSNLRCKDKASIFLDHTLFFRMANSKDKTNKFFHYQDNEILDKNAIYYDRACQRGACYASLTSNVESIFNRFKLERGKFFFLIRDFSYTKALEKKDISLARTILVELEQLVDKFLAMQINDEEMLVIVSSSASIGMDFPKAGREWAFFEKKGEFLNYKSTLLMAPVMSKGAGAENFCGIFKEADLFERILKGQSVKRKFLFF